VLPETPAPVHFRPHCTARSSSPCKRCNATGSRHKRRQETGSELESSSRPTSTYLGGSSSRRCRNPPVNAMVCWGCQRSRSDATVLDQATMMMMMLRLSRYERRDQKFGDFAPTGSLSKISGRRGRPRSHQSFLHAFLGQRMPYNFAADSFHTNKLCSISEVRF